MSPLPQRERVRDYAAKGVHLAMRRGGVAPEHTRARRLQRQSSRAVEVSPEERRRVAILSPRDWAAHVQWEGLIAQALRLRGADVRFMTCGGGLAVCDRVNTWEGPPLPCRSCTRYVERSVDAHGFPRRSLRDGWEEAEDADAEDREGWPELDGLGVEDLGLVEDGGLPLGKLVQVPARWFLMSSNLGEDPLAGATLRRFLRAARRVARGVERALDDLQPDVVLLLNGLFLFEAVAWELCRRRGIDVVTYERGMVKESLVFRRGAPACLGDVSHLWPEWRTVALTEAEEGELDRYLEDRQAGRRTIDRYWRAPTAPLVAGPTPGRTAVLFSNLTWDSAVFGQELAFPTMADWLVAAVDAFARRPQHRLVVRVHPAETKLAGKQTREPVAELLARRCPRLPDNVRLVGADEAVSSYELMEGSDLGLVFTSTTGLELALRDTPVIVAGRTHYRGKGFTIDVDSPLAFETALDAVLDAPSDHRPDRTAARRYAHLFFLRAPVESSFVEEHVPGLVRIDVRDVAELAPGRSAALDRICSGILDGGDFMAPRG